MSLTIIETGPLAIIQDAGRPGLAALGVSRSGAADRAAYALGGRLLGNPDGLATIELTLGGFAALAAGDLAIALTGATAAAMVGARPASWNAPSYLRDGDVLRVGSPRVGLRSYLSVRGGWLVPPVLGSCATDVLSGLGPAQLRPGDALLVGARVTDQPTVDQAALPYESDEPVVLDFRPGPREDWFDLAGLTGASWQVTDQTNRVGTRLSGPPMRRDVAFESRELPSEPVVRGGIQVPPDGHPLIFGPDHPVTGGYPVVGVLTDAASDRLAQCPPGRQIRFRVAR